MSDEKHKQLVDAASTIGCIAEMPHWLTAGMAAKISPDSEIGDLTVKELLNMLSDTLKHVGKMAS